jgi:predicted RNA-binding protein with PIN domain
MIDGHNLIPKIPGLSLKSLDDEIQLIEYLQAFCLQSGKNVEVYFDNAAPGQARSQKFGRVKAHFIQAGRTADQAMIARLRSLGRAAKNWQVVSSDRQVVASARSFQAQVIASEQFASLINPSSTEGGTVDPGTESDVSLKPSEVDAWLNLFNNPQEGGDQD